MIKSIYLRVWKVLLKKPFRLWGISLLCVFLTGLGSSLTAAIPLIAICIAMLLNLGMRQVYLQGYREEEIQVETLFDGFRTGFGKKLAGYAWAELFVLLWGLIPIVGPIFATIRQYEYAFVPYILMERPDTETAERRCDLIQELQSRIMDDFNESRLGTVQEVLAEGYDAAAECWYGRSCADSPDVDGKVFFTGKDVTPGEFCSVRITEILDGDLVGEKEPGIPAAERMQENDDG